MSRLRPCVCKCYRMHVEVRGQSQVVVLSLHLVRDRASSSPQHAPAWLALELRGFSCFPSWWRNARITNEWSLLCPVSPGFCGCKFQSSYWATGALPRSHLSWLLPMDANKSDSFNLLPAIWLATLIAQAPGLFDSVLASKFHLYSSVS